MRSGRVSEGTAWRSIFSRSRKSSSNCDACAAMSAGSLGGRSLARLRPYSATTKSMAWSLGMLRWTGREMGMLMVTCQGTEGEERSETRKTKKRGNCTKNQQGSYTSFRSY